MSRLPLALRVAIHAVLLALAATWLVRPDEPSALFRALVLALLAVLLLPLAVPAWRARWSEALRRRLRVADFLAFNAVCLLLALEGGLRVAALCVDSPLLAPTNANAQERIDFWRGQPGGQRHGFPLNARGMLDEELVEERTPGVRRVVALADSFGFGIVPYRDNFLTILDDLLDAEGETEVVNYGIVSTGPEDYLHLYRTEVRRLQPDLVLVCVYVGNDIRDPGRASLLHRDSLLAFSVLQRLLALRGAVEGAPEDRDGRPLLDEAAWLGIEGRQLEFCQRTLAPRIEAAYETTGRILAELSDAVGPALRVVLIPDAHQVDDALFARLAGGREERYDRGLPQRRLAAALRPHGVPCLDLLPALREAQAAAPTYEHHDTHWNAHGNAVAARTIAAWLADG